ncbi:MAG: hypothetical protein QM747_10325 [Nocardioides sp.]
MTFTPRRRDTTRLAIGTLTAALGATSLTAVGWLAGAASRQSADHQADLAREHAEQAARNHRAQLRYEAALAEQQSAASPKRVQLRSRPSRRVVHTRYVRGATVTIGGGTLSAPQPPASAPQQPAPVHHAPPPPPPPPPPPTSSGS